MTAQINFILLLFNICCLGLNVLSQYDSIPHDGNYRKYLVHLPTNYTSNEEIPLVIAMHGGFGNAYNMQSMSQLSDKADQEDFIVVYPEGVEGGIINASSWNAGWCCGFSSNTNVDDVGFIDVLIDTLSAKLAIDVSRIYATGMSNGGFMAYRLACELSHKIAAIAPVSASMAMENCNPSRPVPVISFHSFLDSNVPYDGGQGDGVSNHYNSPQDSVMNAWGLMNNCQNTQDTLMSNNDYTLIEWSECECKTKVNYYITEDGGHSWHGGNSTLTGDPPSTVVNANDLMWDFFENFSLDCGLLSSAVKNSLDRFQIYPNPAEDFISITCTEDMGDYQVKIYDSRGKLFIETENSSELSITQLPKGIIFVVIDTRLNRWVKKVVKH
jgi:polyhydroxybutyrate depolymerase